MKLLKPHLLGFTLLASILRSGTRIEGEEFCRADLCEFQRTHFEDENSEDNFQRTNFEICRADLCEMNPL